MNAPACQPTDDMAGTGSQVSPPSSVRNRPAPAQRLPSPAGSPQTSPCCGEKNRPPVKRGSRWPSEARALSVQVTPPSRLMRTTPRDSPVQAARSPPTTIRNLSVGATMARREAVVPVSIGRQLSPASSVFSSTPWSPATNAVFEPRHARVWRAASSRQAGGSGRTGSMRAGSAATGSVVAGSAGGEEVVGSRGSSPPCPVFVRTNPVSSSPAQRRTPPTNVGRVRCVARRCDGWAFLAAALVLTRTVGIVSLPHGVSFVAADCRLGRDCTPFGKSGRDELCGASSSPRRHEDTKEIGGSARLVWGTPVCIRGGIDSYLPGRSDR